MSTNAINNANKKKSPTPGRQIKTKRPVKPQTYTIADAFQYFEIPEEDDGPENSPLNNERCVRAVAFLLHYCSTHGNERVDGFIAEGLAEVLEQCASKTDYSGRFRKWLESLKGDGK